MAWNCYPQHVIRDIIHNFDENRHTNPTNLNEQQLDEKDDIPAIWLRIPYIGPQGESLVSKCISKLKGCMKNKNIKFIVMYNTKKIAFFCSKKIKLQIAYAQILSTSFHVQDVAQNMWARLTDAFTLEMWSTRLMKIQKFLNI